MALAFTHRRRVTPVCFLLKDLHRARSVKRVNIKIRPAKVLACCARPDSSKTQPVRRLANRALRVLFALGVAPSHRRFVLPGTIRILELQSARRALSVIDVQREALLKSPAQVVTIRIRPGITIAKFVRPAHIKMTPVKSLAGIVRRGPNAPVPA